MTVVSESPEAQAGGKFCISTKAWSFLFFPFSEYSGHVARKREVVANRMQTVKEISLGIYNNTCHFCLTWWCSFLYESSSHLTVVFLGVVMPVLYLTCRCFLLLRQPELMSFGILSSSFSNTSYCIRQTAFTHAHTDSHQHEWVSQRKWEVVRPSLSWGVCSLSRGTHSFIRR